MSESNAYAPLALGTGSPTGSGAGGNYGYVVEKQSVVLTHNTTNAVSGTIYLPYAAGPAQPSGAHYCQIIHIFFDTTTAWNSATSDTGSVGKTAGGTEFASGVDTKTAASRIEPTYTGTQLTNMQNVGQGTIVATITPVGSATAGSTTVTVLYVVAVALNPILTA